ncbi:MAG: hypothetical protein ACE5G0_15375 [Rhodothermales bacterium]
MAHWYEVFDNEEVQSYARRQATRLTALAVGAVMITFLGAALGFEGYLPLPLVGGIFIVTWLVTVRWVSHRLRKLRRLVWCIKLSPHRVVGYDYTRRKATMEWSKVQRVELTGNGLLLVGPDVFAFEIPHLFPDFALLSHRVVHYAELHGIPVFVDGHPWQHLDVYQLFPFLTDHLSTGASGTAA